MGVLSFSSVKNDLLIYWGRMGCWPLGQAEPDIVNMVASGSHCLSPSAATAICKLSGSRRELGTYLRGLGLFPTFSKSPPS